MSDLLSHAQREFHAVGWTDEQGIFKDPMQQLMCEQVTELLTHFISHGHSGSSAPYAVELFSKLALYKNLCPLTGGDDEWVEVSDGVFQNRRCSHVFKDKDQFNGQAYDIYARVFYDEFVDEDGTTQRSYFTSSKSHQPIEFPYTPRSEYLPRLEDE